MDADEYRREHPCCLLASIVRGIPHRVRDEQIPTSSRSRGARSRRRSCPSGLGARPDFGAGSASSPREFSARARKTTPVAGAPPIPFRSLASNRVERGIALRQRHAQQDERRSGSAGVPAREFMRRLAAMTDTGRDDRSTVSVLATPSGQQGRRAGTLAGCQAGFA